MAREDKIREQNKTIRQLRAQIRQLRKENKLVQAEMELIRGLWEQDIIDMAKKERRKRLNKKKEDLCPDCGNPTVNVTNIGIWTLIRCSACEFFDRRQEEDEGN